MLDISFVLLVPFVAAQNDNRTRKLIVRLPPEPLPGPKKKVFEPEGDCKKNGDAMFPTGAPLFVRFKTLLALMEKLIA
jgi:hypothetical protein